MRRARAGQRGGEIIVHAGCGRLRTRPHPVGNLVDVRRSAAQLPVGELPAADAAAGGFRGRGAAMSRRSTAGVTLMELLIAVLLLSLLSTGLLFALRIGLNAYSKTQTRSEERRVGKECRSRW